MRAISAILLGSALALATRGAAAEDLRLSWRAPEGCPSEERVRDAALRSAPSDQPREPIDAEVQVDHRERWTVTIRTKRGGVAAAERRLDATSCEALADATAVILAMALVPPAEAVPVPAPVATPAPPAEPTAAEPAATVGPDRLPPAREQDDPYAHALSVGAALATDGTTLPSPALGGRGALAWTPGRARFELAAAYFSSQSKTTGSSPAGADFTLAVTGVRACWAVARGAVELAPCIGSDVQLVEAQGYGASANYDASAAWLSAAGGAIVRVPVAGWLALRGDVDAVVPLSRPRFVVEGDGAVHRPDAFGVRAGIGAELLFL